MQNGCCGTKKAAGIDEMEPMSWNNGLVSAQIPGEFRLSVRWAEHAPEVRLVCELVSGAPYGTAFRRGAVHG